MGNTKSIGIAYEDQDITSGTFTDCVITGRSGKNNAVGRDQTISGGNGAGGTNGGGNVNLVPGTAVSTGTPGEVQVNGNSQLIPINIAFTATDATRRVFIATRPMRIKAVSSEFTTASSSGTWTVEKTPSGTAPGSGTVLLSAVIALSGTANTPANGTVLSTIATITLAAGDSISIVVAGTMTNLVGGVGTIMMTPT